MSGIGELFCGCVWFALSMLGGSCGSGVDVASGVASGVGATAAPGSLHNTLHLRAALAEARCKLDVVQFRFTAITRVLCPLFMPVCHPCKRIGSYYLKMIIDIIRNIRTC